KRWVSLWGELRCSEITNEMIQRFVLERTKVSLHTANKEVRLLRATFNFGKKKKWITSNPVDGIDFFPVDKRPTYIPNLEDIEKVIAQAKSDKWLKARFPDTPDYLETLQDTFGRISEINRLEWTDVDFGQKSLVLYTRKIDGGLTPREVRMTERLYEILSRRYAERDKSKPWVFWNPRTGRPYKDRKKFMKRLCKKAGVPYFRFHPIRHSGASVMDNNNVPAGAIQRILGHKNRTTTEIYLHGLGEGEREAIETFEAVREKKVSHRREIIPPKPLTRP
ncbi:site-specific integrase, partial [Acidobacteria bacterium AH-259-O06]|nr:site-specific integrase [Acidobacteria bacterium AH-259-O06]